MPRPKTGQVYVEAHGEHLDMRFDLPKGGRSKRRCMAAGMTVAEVKAEARRLKDLAWELGAELMQSAGGGPKTETMDVWVDRWLKDRKERGLRSVDDDGGRWRRWLFPILGDLHVGTVQRRDLEKVVEDLDRRVRAGELSWKTARLAWGLVTKMFSDAVASKRLDLRARTDNPAAGVRGPDTGIEKAKAYLYPVEFSALVSCPEVPIRWRRLFALAVYTYTRPGELGALEWDDVDLERGTIHIHRALGDDATKGTKTGVTRRIPLEAALASLLRTMDGEPHGSRVVASMPPECDLAARLRTYLKRAGVTRAELFANDSTRKQITFYDLRATGITWMAIRGDEPLRIMQRAGHKNFETTMGYVREAETLGDVGKPFPELPNMSVTEPEGPADWGALRGVDGQRRVSHPFPTQKTLSARNYASPAGFEPA